MSVISRTGDLFYAFRFLKLLTTKWEDTEAFKNGIIDDTGKVLIKSRELKDPEAKSTYTVFHRLVFNVKRLLEKLPFGKTKLASYAAALFLIKEHTGMSEKDIVTLIEKATGESANNVLVESAWFESDNQLTPGVYTLSKDILCTSTGERVAVKNTKIVVEQALKAEASFCGVNIYAFKIANQQVFISNQDLLR